ncbi:MAG: hypothetical protein ACFFCV_13465 [Promethearchaeota archaeon]
MKNDNNDKIAIDIKLQNYYNLSILDLLTLQILLNQVKPVKRHSLYLEVNSLLLNKEKKLLLNQSSIDKSIKDFTKIDKEIKSISTSSFYNNLVNLEKKGLIKFIRKKNKVKEVEKTEITLNFIKIIFHSLLETFIPNLYKFPKGSAMLIKEKYNLVDLDPGLIIYVDEFHEFGLDFFLKVSENMTILTEKSFYKYALKGIDKFTFTHVENGLIREPEGFFNGIYLGRFRKDIDFFGLTAKDLIKEAIRVLKPGGYITISTYLFVEPINHIFIDGLINIYNELNINYIFTEEELRGLLEPNGINDIEFLKFQGYLITIGSKLKN